MNKLFIDNESYNIEEDNITISQILRLVVMYKETSMLILLK